MALNTKENHKDENKTQKERRSFLKKTVYSAPSIIILGQLARPTRSNAFDEPPIDPSGERLAGQ